LSTAGEIPVLKVVFYPLIGLVVCGGLFFTVCAISVAVGDARRKRAERTARWVPYTTIRGSGLAEVGVQLLARWWPRHRKVLQRETMCSVPADDLQALFEAETEATVRAQAYNTLQREQT